MRTAVHGGLRLEEYAYSLQALGDGEILHAGNALRGDADLEGSEAVDVDALGSLQGIGDDLHHLGEDGLGVGLLGRGVALNPLGDAVEVEGSVMCSLLFCTSL